jgi:3-hydroxyacyl-[acyl-carrier-protein] dehydratase
MALEIDDSVARHPGSYPFLLVDKVLGVTPGESAVGLRNVTANDVLLAAQGRKPATMRRALLIEAFSQLTAMALGPDSKHPLLVELAEIQAMTFTKTPVPGGQIVLNVELSRDDEKATATCKAEVDGAPIATGTLLFDIRGD